MEYKLHSFKIRKYGIIKILVDFDIIWISELKTDTNVHLPGYKCFRNTIRYNNHGGVGLFVKDRIKSYVQSVQYHNDDCIYISFTNIPNVVFYGCYIPPNESLYYNNDIFATLSSSLCHENRLAVIFGDFNAKIKDFNDLLQGNSLYSYNLENKQQNRNGDILKSICINNGMVVVNGLIEKSICINNDMVVVNGLIEKSICINNDMVVVNGLIEKCRKFDDSMTYKRKNKWISRIDMCLISPTLISLIDSFSVIQNAHLPSDHAIITCTIKLDYNVASEYILQRSSVLGEYHAPLKQQGKKKISFDAVDKVRLKHRLELPTPPIIEFDNIDNCVTWLNNNIFESTSACIAKNNKTWETKEANRWNRLLNSNDPKYIWNAIDWKGKMSVNESKDTPSTGDFKVHFEGLLFNSDNVTLDNIVTSTSPYIPLLDDEITTHEMLKCITEVKHNKANDMNGNTPGIVKNLPPALFIFISHLLNAIFRFAKFPLAWAVSKLIVLFKKDD